MINPNSLFTVCFFIIIASLLSVGFGWSVRNNKLPIRSEIDYNDNQWKFLKIWVKFALLLGIILPVVLLVVFRDRSIVSKFFLGYLLAVAVQLMSEKVFGDCLCKSTVVFIGMVYTGFRIWQLGSGLQLINYGQPWFSLLWSVFLFWVANMVMLVTFAVPVILPKSGESEQFIS
ncbi:MAG: hypothetical protein QNJ72_40950 [Pleurocapsa sp. MO_226.B13]|nr:hypothetical protein [Pleurocapsa sp. MO_226.B13]